MSPSAGSLPANRVCRRRKEEVRASCLSVGASVARQHALLQIDGLGVEHIAHNTAISDKTAETLCANACT